MAMDPVSSADRLIMILRKKLEERAKAATSGRKEGPGPISARTSRGPRDIHRIAAESGASERQLRRRFLQNILADEFGHELINAAPFQQVVDKVSNAIEADPKAANLLSRVIADLEG